MPSETLVCLNPLVYIQLIYTSISLYDMVGYTKRKSLISILKIFWFCQIFIYIAAWQPG